MASSMRTEINRRFGRAIRQKAPNKVGRAGANPTPQTGTADRLASARAEYLVSLVALLLTPPSASPAPSSLFLSAAGFSCDCWLAVDIHARRSSEMIPSAV